MAIFKSLFSFTKTEVDAAFRQAKLRKKIAGFTLLSAPLPTDATHGKLLIVTPARVGTAVQRNNIRRRLKAIYYEQTLFEKVQISIILVYPPAVELEFSDLEKFLIENVK